MKRRSSRARIARILPAVLVAAALVVVCFSSASIAAPTDRSSTQAQRNAGGKWSGRYRGDSSGTFTLRWTQTGSKLKGSITLSNPAGTYPISGILRGNKISFGAVGVGATYKGTVSGKAMSGTWKSASRGGTWSARKT